MLSNKFKPFNRVDLTFRTINEHPLEATILIPKSLQLEASAKHPVLVHWHGGGFIVGHRMHEEWFALW
jgi:carboxylesterase type B